MRPRILTDEQLTQIRAIIAARRALPTHIQLARRYGVSKRLIDEIATGKAYRVPRGTELVSVTTLQNEVLDAILPKP